ncbi:vacuolar assembly protein [Blastomyces dermatitidis ER-3]|uniref:Vacuolar assembly protein n=2 Tax=Ajellomyces dermatitidis TaxID=5039 RepID=F2TMY5_AJEDA|nr:vacuolar assembly protein [Blastomyces dermatitidis ER-3]EEQ84361.2 vacuolar assembly protein [Blastomyces dermatitidis ER-3]EGE84598.1 vacuolar assembly protein [Blastomyces dermatitidis ATCC 18188]
MRPLAPCRVILLGSIKAAGMEVDDTKDSESDGVGLKPTGQAAGRPRSLSPAAEPSSKDVEDNYSQQSDEEAGDEDEDDEEEEPRLKYASLTKSIGSVYRNGDATSSFLTAGDKMIVGTHNGNIHVLSVPSFQILRVYHAHSATVSSISISPFPPSLPMPQLDTFRQFSSDSNSIKSQSTTQKNKNSTKAQPAIPATPSNSIYIASSSIDGNVCVSSLVDPRDVLLRNFGRPVQAVALSPEYKNDKSYISGGLAGTLVLTTGGKVGTKSNSTVMGVSAPNTSGWLGSLGLGGNSGKDVVLHSGEGTISTIKWSLSGKYVMWVNEEGIKIMRTNLHLENADSEFAWKRMSHIDRPNRPGWEEMASVWKPRAEWVDENSVDVDDDPGKLQSQKQSPAANASNCRSRSSVEKLVVGWGGTVWIINVFPGGSSTGKDVGERKIGSVGVATILRTDCIISGVSLYTPNLLLVLSYLIPEDENDESNAKQAGPRRGIRHRQNGLEPELRLIDIETKEELSADTLSVKKYQTFSASDYHLGVLPPIRAPTAAVQRGALEAIGTGLWDATLYPTRLFSSAASVRSNGSSGDKGSSIRGGSSINSMGLSASDKQAKELAITATGGIKIFIHSPYDCIIAIKRGIVDRLAWLDSHEKYEEAWELIVQHPEAAAATLERAESLPSTPTKPQSTLADFFSDDNASVKTAIQAANSAPEMEKRRIGERWLEQLLSQENWERAGQVCGKVLRTTSRWEHWIWIFARNNKFDEITPHVPIEISPPLPSLIYEVILGHYVSRDRIRFKELLELWPTDLFDITSVTAVIEDQLQSKVVTSGSDDWKILMDSLAKLFLAGRHYREALHCYISLQDDEAAMRLIREYHLLDAIADDIPGFILIRVSKDQLKSASIPELDAATVDPIKVLVREAANGVVGPEAVVSQLQATNRRLFLFFYLRTLWRGDATSTAIEKPSRFRHQKMDAAEKLVVDERRALIDGLSDIVIELFAEYDRQLLMEFLQSSTSYSYSAASSICESRRYIPELIYLLSKTGQTKRALNLILSDLKDVSYAISFAKSQDDPDLWEDLLSFSMDKPEYIRGLLAEAGTSIDPINLVRRIPSGLEIEGLREGLTRMIREHDIQASISQGVAKVLEGEVATRMDILRQGQRRGIKFDIVTPSSGLSQKQQDTQETEELGRGRCAGCRKLFSEQETETLIGFACGHIFHVSHLHLDHYHHQQPPTTTSNTTTDHEQRPTSPTPTLRPPPPPPQTSSRPHTASTSSPSHPDYATTQFSPLFSRTVGPKVTNARLLRDKVGDGCGICTAKSNIDEAAQGGIVVLRGK